MPGRTSVNQPAFLIDRLLVPKLMALYDFPDPRKPGRLIRGYDRSHAVRTARMCAAVARHLGHPSQRVKQYQIACLLHDLGRAGLDRRLFGKIWSWAHRHKLPTRPREWRSRYPRTKYGFETEAFLDRYETLMAKEGIPMDTWAHEQVEMRLGYARRLDRMLKSAMPRLKGLGIQWQPWMKHVMLYYYYPEKLAGASLWVRELAEILVACEQFEAYSNRQRGNDYYVRRQEHIKDAFGYLRKLQREGMLTARVVDALAVLAAEGAFDGILTKARGAPLRKDEIGYLRRLGHKEPS